MHGYLVTNNLFSCELVSFCNVAIRAEELWPTFLNKPFVSSLRSHNREAPGRPLRQTRGQALCSLVQQDGIIRGNVPKQSPGSRAFLLVLPTTPLWTCGFHWNKSFCILPTIALTTWPPSFSLSVISFPSRLNPGTDLFPKHSRPNISWSRLQAGFAQSILGVRSQQTCFA